MANESAKKGDLESAIGPAVPSITLNAGGGAQKHFIEFLPLRSEIETLEKLMLGQSWTSSIGATNTMLEI